MLSAAAGGAAGAADSVMLVHSSRESLLAAALEVCIGDLVADSVNRQVFIALYRLLARVKGTQPAAATPTQPCTLCRPCSVSNVRAANSPCCRARLAQHVP
jgi:hypothetical protein